jgi:hypothetical protein
MKVFQLVALLGAVAITATELLAVDYYTYRLAASAAARLLQAG